MSDRFAAPKKTKKLRKTVLKVNTDKKDEYIFFLEYVILHYQKNAFTVFENLKKSLIQHDILSGQKFIKNAQNIVNFGEFLKT